MCQSGSPTSEWDLRKDWFWNQNSQLPSRRPPSRGSRARQWPLPAPPWKSELEGSQECVTSQLMPEGAPSWMVEKEQGLQTLEKWNLPSKELPQSIYPLVDLQGLTLKWFPPSTLKLKRRNEPLSREYSTCIIPLKSPKNPLKLASFSPFHSWGSSEQWSPSIIRF